MKKVFVDPWLFFDEELLSDKPVFIEVGSFTGDHANKLCDIYKAKVIIYEASKNNFKLLKDKVNNKSIIIHNKAISGSDGTLEFFDFTTPSSNSTFPRHTVEKNKKVLEKYNVKAVTLETAIKDNMLKKVDAVFFNCEGSEISILNNFFENKKLHSVVAQLSVSFHPQIYGKEPISEILEKAKANGFERYVSDKKWPCTLFVKS